MIGLQITTLAFLWCMCGWFHQVNIHDGVMWLRNHLWPNSTNLWQELRASMPHLAIFKCWSTCAYIHMTHIQKVYARLTCFKLWHVNPHMWTSNMILNFASANFMKKAHIPMLTNPHKWVTVEHLMLHGHALSIITRMLHGFFHEVETKIWNKTKEVKGDMKFTCWLGLRCHMPLKPVVWAKKGLQCCMHVVMLANP